MDQVASLGPRGPGAALTQLTHRLCGLAGTIGFPTVTLRASELEILLDRPGPFDAARARGCVEAMREAFARDAANPPDWATSGPPHGAKILVAEDECDQLGILTACLEGAGYVTVPVESGDLVVETARAEKPALILLDIVLPKVDGYSVCRRLKADPELAGIPVILITAGANLDDRLAALTLGADEFLIKPVDMRELVLRIHLAIDLRGSRRAAPMGGGLGVPRELTYDAFLAVAREEVARSPAALAMVRLPTDRHGEAAILLAEELRGRDVIGAYDLTRMLILMPEMTAAAARDRLDAVVDRLTAHGLSEVCMGVTAVSQAAAKTAETLIGEADEALAEARYLGHTTAMWIEHRGRSVAAAPRAIVVADDDPDVARIVEAQLRAAGYKVTLAADGEQALAAVRAQAPDVLVLDLTMPRLDGFEVLGQLRGGVVPGPRVIVLSARGRDEDVKRAFDLGANDYMTKPFMPEELMARVTRLLR